MQDAKRAISHFRSLHWIAIAAMVLVFLMRSVCAQDLRAQKECETLFSTAVSAEQQNDFIEAELRYEDCRTLAQKSRLPKMEASALHRLAVIRARNKKFSESANLFRRAIDLDRRNALILSDFAQLHADRKDFDEAEILLRKALDVEPNNPKILFNLARIYRSNGDIRRAEFAEQKAQLVSSQTTPSDSKDSTSVPVRPSHQPQTPPEVVNRVRQENFNAEAREMIEAQQRAVMPAVGQMPFIPAPVNPAGTAQVPAATPQPYISAASPVDPFATVARPQESVASPVRKLESSLADAFAQTTVRTIPKRTEPLPNIQPSGQNSVRDPFAPVQAVTNNTANGVPDQQFIRIVSPAKTETLSPLPTRPLTPDSSNPQNGVPIQALPSGAKPYERTSATNPLHQTLPGGAGLIDPVADVPHLATLPSYSAVETKRMPRIDKSIFPIDTEIPEETKPQPSGQSSGIIAFEATSPTAPKAEFVQSSKPLPVRDVDVLQSPSAIIARRESSGVRTISSAPTASGNTYQPTRTTSIHAMQSSPITLEPESIKILHNEQGFSSTNVPNVLAFGSTDKKSAMEKPVEIASVQPLEQNTSIRSIVRLPAVQQETDYPKTIAHITPPQAPVVSAPIAASPSPFSQVKTIEPLTAPPAPAAVAVVQPSPFSATDNTTVFGSVRSIDPLTPTLSHPAPVATLQPDSFSIQDSGQPKFAAAIPTPTLPSVSTPPVAPPVEELPRIAATRTPEPLPTVTHVPTHIPQQIAVASPAPHLSAPVGELPKQLPAKQESTGFASTRKAAPQVATTDDQPGFARSRR